MICSERNTDYWQLRRGLFPELNCDSLGIGDGKPNCYYTCDDRQDFEHFA